MRYALIVAMNAREREPDDSLPPSSQFGTRAERFGQVTVYDLAPVFLVRFEDRWTFEEMGAAYDRVADVAPRRFILITEAQLARPAGAFERQRIREILNKLLARVDQRVVLSAIVAESAVMRGTVRTVLWLVRVNHPILVLPNMRDAYEAARNLASKESLHLPASIESRLQTLARARAGG
jgi:hypothetical protein